MPRRRETSRQPLSSVLTIDEVAAYLKVGRLTLHRPAQEGKLPGLKVGRYWRFRGEAIDRWLESASESRRAGTI